MLARTAAAKKSSKTIKRSQNATQTQRSQVKDINFAAFWAKINYRAKNGRRAERSMGRREGTELLRRMQHKFKSSPPSLCHPWHFPCCGIPSATWACLEHLIYDKLATLTTRQLSLLSLPLSQLDSVYPPPPSDLAPTVSMPG